MFVFQLTLVGTDGLTGTPENLHAPTLNQTALLQQAGVATFTLGDQGQQVYVITDPAQLEALQVQSSAKLYGINKIIYTCITKAEFTHALPNCFNCFNVEISHN